MSKKVSVILLEDINRLGQAGDIISVSEGYARNFLFLEGKAALATTEARAKQAAEAKHRETTKSMATQATQELAQTMEGTELTLRARLKEGNQIFGRITRKQIADELNKQVKLKLTPKQIDLATDITTLSSQDVTINLTKEVAATIRVTVEAEP